MVVQIPGKTWKIQDGENVHRISARPTALLLNTRDLWDGPADLTFFAIWLGVLFFNLVFMDVNLTSPHGFYRDRLSRVFLFRERKDGEI